MIPVDHFPAFARIREASLVRVLIKPPSGAGVDLKPQVVEACLGTHDHHRFHNQNRFGQLGEISPRRLFSL